jgi:hypothetical protein
MRPDGNVNAGAAGHSIRRPLTAMRQGRPRVHSCSNAGSWRVILSARGVINGRREAMRAAAILTLGAAAGCD